MLDVEHLAVRLLEVLAPTEGEKIAARYNLPLETVAESEPFDLLEQIGRKRGMLLPGGHVNTERAAITVVDEFRGGQWGRITLEKSP